MLKKLCTLMLSFLLVFGAMPAFASSIDVLVSEGFNNLTTNSRDGFGAATIGGTGGKIALKGDGDKALLVSESEGSTKLVTALTTKGELADIFVYSLEIKRAAASMLTAAIGMGTASAHHPALTIENNVIRLTDGKKIGAIAANGYTELTMVYKQSSKLLTVYIDGARKVKDWPFYDMGTSFSRCYISSPAGGGEFYLDNIKVYNAAEPREVTVEGFSNKSVDDVYIDDDPADYTYFRSDSAATLAKKYFNYTAVPKTGKIVEERLDYKNANRGEDIVLTKTTTDDVYIDIAINKHAQWESAKTYQYFYIAEKVWIDNTDMKLNLCTIRDKTQEGQPLSYVLRTEGTTLIAGGKRFVNALKVQDYTNVEIYLDMSKNTADIYVGGELLTKDVTFNSGTKLLSLVRMGFQGGDGYGVLKLRDVEVTGLVKKPIDGNIERTSVYADTSSIEEYLFDKVSFHHFSEVIYKNGEKIPFKEASLYEDGLYISLADALVAFEGAEDLSQVETKKADDGKELISVNALAKKLGKHVLDDGFGMVIVSDETMYWDLSAEVPHFMQDYVSGHFTRLSPIQHMNAFLTFERPSAEEIKKAFNEKTNNGEMHPRLMGTKEDFDRIKEDAKTDAELKRIIDQLISQADAIIPKEPVYYHYNDSYRTWNMAFQFMRQMEQLGLAYQLTGEQKYLDRAWLDIKSVCSFPDFNEAHVIDAGMYMTGMAFGYDWLYHGLTKEQKSIMEDAVMKLGIEVIDRAFYMGLPSAAVGSLTVDTMQQTSYFTKWRSNYVPYTVVGLIGSALAFAEINPDICFDLIEKSLRATEYAMFGLVPDGAWIEGVDYWEVTVGNICRYMSFMEKSLGTNYNLWKAQGFKTSARAKAAEESFHGSVAHSDSQQNNGSVTSYAYPWFAKMLGQNDLAALRQLYLKDVYGKYGLVAPTVLGLDVLYYTKADLNDAQNFPKVQVFRGLESFSVRENYGDPKTFYFFSQAGQAFHYHGHNDCGSFAFEMDDVRWAMDLGKDSYDLHSGDRYYQIYRKRTEGHNTLTINNGDYWNQKETEYCAVTDFAEGEGGAYGVYDMTSLYRDVNSVKRGFYIDENYSRLTVRDEIDVAIDSEVWWFMHTMADIEILDKNTAILSMDGKTLTVQVKTDCPEFELSQMDAVPLDSAPAINVNGKTNDPNNGIRKLAIRMKGKGAWNLTVRMSTNGGGEIFDKPISEWTAPTKTEKAKTDFGYSLYVSGKKVNNASIIPVLRAEEIPEFKIVPNDPTISVIVENDPKELGKKVAVKLITQDGSKEQNVRISYSASSESVLEYFEKNAPKAASASEEPEAANVAANLTDGSLATRWTGKTEDCYAILDYGSKISIDAFTAAFWKGNTRKYSFELLASNDGENFTPIGKFTSSGTSEDYELYWLDEKISARYIKIVNKGNTANKYCNPTEILMLRYLGE
ncbi:MAG: heparinase II/III family protein [Clostridia bacterium]|nr:heparinase II/III family protein [Clostridia bacterium]